MSRARDAGASPRATGPAARCRSLWHERFRIVVRKKRRHVELAGLQIISAAPAIHHAGLHGLAGLDVGVPRKADEEIPVLRPNDAEPAIALLGPLQEIHRNVILGLLPDLSPLGTAFEISPCQVAQRRLGRGNEALRTLAVQME